MGDLLEAKVQGKKITLTPKVVGDRAFVEKRLARGLKDIKEGRVLGPFKTAREAIRALRARIR